MEPITISSGVGSVNPLREVNVNTKVMANVSAETTPATNADEKLITQLEQVLSRVSEKGEDVSTALQQVYTDLNAAGANVDPAKLDVLKEVLHELKTGKKPLNLAALKKKLDVFPSAIATSLAALEELLSKPIYTQTDAKNAHDSLLSLIESGVPSKELGSAKLTSFAPSQPLPANGGIGTVPSSLTSGLGAAPATAISFTHQEFKALLSGDVMLALVFACLSTYEAENESLRSIASEATVNSNAVQGLNALSNVSNALGNVFQQYNAANPNAQLDPPTLDNLITKIYTAPANTDLINQLKSALSNLAGAAGVGTSLSKLSFGIAPATLPGNDGGSHTIAQWVNIIQQNLPTPPATNVTSEIAGTISAVVLGITENVNGQLGITNNGNTLPTSLSSTTSGTGEFQCFTADDLSSLASSTKQATDSATTITSRSQAEGQTRTTTAQAAMTATMSFLSQWGQILKTAASGQ